MLCRPECYPPSIFRCHSALNLLKEYEHAPSVEDLQYPCPCNIDFVYREEECSFKASRHTLNKPAINKYHILLHCTISTRSKNIHQTQPCSSTPSPSSPWRHILSHLPSLRTTNSPQTATPSASVPSALGFKTNNSPPPPAESSSAAPKTPNVTAANDKTSQPSSATPTPPSSSTNSATPLNSSGQTNLEWAKELLDTRQALNPPRRMPAVRDLRLIRIRDR